MHIKLVLFLTVFVACFAHTLSAFTDPFPSFGRVVKNEANKIISTVEGDVRRMQIKNPFSSMLLRGEPTGDMPKLGKGTKLPQSPFNWTTCDSSSQVFDIKSLTLKPSPLSLPGTLTFSFDVVIHENLDKTDNLTAALTLEFLTGSTWLKIPCLGMVGSCTYTDLCSVLSSLSCPSDITKQGVRCNCPFPKGEYKLQPYSVEVDAEVFINGHYRAVIDMTSTTKGRIGCYKLAFEIM